MTINLVVFRWELWKGNGLIPVLLQQKQDFFMIWSGWLRRILLLNGKPTNFLVQFFSDMGKGQNLPQIRLLELKSSTNWELNVCNYEGLSLKMSFSNDDLCLTYCYKTCLVSVLDWWADSQQRKMRQNLQCLWTLCFGFQLRRKKPPGMTKCCLPWRNRYLKFYCDNIWDHFKH